MNIDAEQILHGGKIIRVMLLNNATQIKPSLLDPFSPRLNLQRIKKTSFVKVTNFGNAICHAFILIALTDSMETHSAKREPLQLRIPQGIRPKKIIVILLSNNRLPDLVSFVCRIIDQNCGIMRFKIDKEQREQLTLSLEPKPLILLIGKPLNVIFQVTRYTFYQMISQELMKSPENMIGVK